MLDEPLTDVDAGTAKLLLSVIEDWHTEGRTVIAVLHDMTVVRRHFPIRGCWAGFRDLQRDAQSDPRLKAA